MHAHARTPPSSQLHMQSTDRDAHRDAHRDAQVQEIHTHTQSSPEGEGQWSDVTPVSRKR
eukprot:1223956-Pleurochrysis_carterae.AAC.1